MKPKRFYFRNTPHSGAPLRYGVSAVIGFAVLISGFIADAGDILRGGGVRSNGNGAPAAGAGSGGAAASSDAARANARDTLARTTRALDAVRAMQNAARNAAISGANNLGTTAAPLPAVPNGIALGGLHPAPVGTDPLKPQKNVWTGAELLPVNPADATKVTIKQTTQQALLHWQTFNVGKETTLTFDQSAGGENVGQWIAFNKISDPSGNPTQILGSIKADGQVYIINTNGIIFGGSSQVNARSLTVSSLPINDNLINRGLLNNPDAQFLFSGLAIPAGLNGTPAFTPEAPPSTTGKYGDVVVQQGAILNSPTNTAKVGGRITLVGSNVSNLGSILTPDGQAILAAGLQVGFDGHSSSDPSLRGLDVFVGAVADPLAGLYTGTVTQDGMIEAPRGSITIAGREINHNGGLVSTTSVSLNGRIDIQASYNAVSNRASTTSAGALFLFKNTGAVNLGPESVLRILPEYDSNETTIGTELALRSKINISGKTIRVGEASVLLAPNAQVSLVAGNWLYENATPPRSTFVQSGGQVYLEQDAEIDVSGSLAVPVSVAQNIISVDLRSAELADSPLQRLGVLRNATVAVDIRNTGDGWIGTPLADVSGFANLIQRSVGQLTVAGGSVTINAGGSVVMQSGSNIAVSGGSTLFEGGMVRTTRLITGGRLVDIGSATPDVVYDGIYDGTFTESNPKFGVANVFDGVITPAGFRYEAGYTQGAAGGKLSITAASMALDGRLSGTTVVGDNQRITPPARSTLTLAFQAQDIAYPTFPLYSPTPPTVTFTAERNLPAAAPFATDVNGNPAALSSARLQQVYLSPELMSGGGFGVLSIDNHDGTIIIPNDVSITAAPGGEIAFTASNIRIDGGISIPSGKISFNSPNLSLATINKLDNTSGGALPDPVAGRGVFTLGASGVVSTSGLLIDDRLSADMAGPLPLFLNGGSININAYSADLAAGGKLDVSGGVHVNPRGTVSYGNGGSILISAGRDLDQTMLLGGHLSLGATLAGYSGAKAASLTLQAPAFQIGGSTPNTAVNVLAGEFFNQGGFGTFSITGLGLASDTPGKFVTGVHIAPQTTLRPIVSGWLANMDGGEIELQTVTREEGVRSPGSLTFSALGAIDNFSSTILGRGDVVLAEGASILTDAKGAVSFSGETVTLAGSVTCPGGTISVIGALRFPSLNPDTLLPTVLLGNTAYLSTAGKVVLIENAYHRRQGQVLAGGAISVTGNIVAERGAQLDVSGTSGILDLPPSSLSLDPALVNSSSGRNYVPVTVDSNGGRITLSGSRMLYSDATLIGRAGGTSATGGSVAVSSGRFVAVGTESNTAQSNLVVRQDGFLVPSDFVSRGLGTPLTDSSGSPLQGIGNFTVSTFSAGGFDSLSLNGNVAFDGDVSIHTPGSLRVSSGGVISGQGNVSLRSGYVNLGQAFTAPKLATETVILFTKSDVSGVTTPYSFAPTYGDGGLSVDASLVDIGNLSLDGLGTIGINAAGGDIRGNGTLSVAGNLNLKAGQIYPTSAGRFDIFAYDFTSGGQSMQGTVSITGGSTRQLPLSAGGSLGVYASQIHQGGVLRAPVGTIKLGWDGTGTAPFNPIVGRVRPSPVTSALTLSGDGITSVSAMDPLTGKPTIIPYGISQDGKSWIDPAGNDITVSGVPGKSVHLAAVDLVTAEGSVVDISGGGDLYAYRWISGNGGSADILASSSSFAVIPGYGFSYSPYAPFNTDSSAVNLGGAPGYTNAALKAGDQITLSASKNLAAGTYTLLPARYALLPGALLITPKSIVPNGTVTSPDGASIVSGYRSNNLDPSRTGPTLIGGFEVAQAQVFRTRAEYQDLLANTVLREAAISREFTVPRLPVDAGYLAFSSTSSMALRGRVSSLAPTSGRGSLIDINSSSDILINPTGAAVTGAGLVLSVETLNSFGAESLLIGGLRSFNSNGVSVTANSANVTLDNAGAALTGNDVVLVSREKLILGENSKITSTENDDLSLDTLFLGSAGTAGSGNGSLVRVSANASGSISRMGTSTSVLPELTLRSGVILTGGSIVLDSTSGTSLSESARLIADGVSLNSGQISISLDNPGILNPTTGLVLAGDAFASLQSSAKRLALLSYSTIDVYGTGAVGSRNFESLSLQAATLRGLNTNGGSVTFSANRLMLGNSADTATPALLTTPLSGSVTFDADQITLGANAIQLDGYAAATLAATASIITEKHGSLDVAGDLDLVTPRLTGASASNYQIRSRGALELARPAVTRPAPFNGGFGADLTLQGSSVKVNGDITLPSGKLTLRATTGDLTLGDASTTTLDLAGTATTFIDTIRYTSGGTVDLVADNGSVSVLAAATINVSAKQGGGNAGTIQVKAPSGTLDLAGVIIGTSGDTGEKGKFSLDMGSITGGSLTALDAILNAGSFTQSRDYRVRNGNVNIDGPATAHSYRVSADSGNITVSNTIDASGVNGGVIDLKAHGSLTLASGSLLDASAAKFDSAGKGGSVTLEAGNQRNGVVQTSATLDLQTGSTINLSVAEADAGSEALGKFTGTLHLRAPRNAANTDLQINTIGSSITGASSILVEGVKLYGLTGIGTITSTLQNTIKSDATAFLGAAGTTTAGYTAMLGRLTSLQPALDLILAPGAEIYNLNGSLTLGASNSTASSDWNLETFRFGPRSAAGVLTLRASENLTFFNALSDGFSGGTSLWLAPLMAHNPLLPANTQSWSLRMAAGADLSAADYHSVRPAAALGTSSGLLQLGKNAGAATITGGANARTSSLITNLFQVIRTGSGDIDISTGGNLQLLNPFASIYTAGTRLADATTIINPNDFVTPIIDRNVQQGDLGSAQQNYLAQYSMAGGNVTIAAGGNIERKTRNNSGLIDDSSRQMPNNWLYRRGYLDANGEAGRIRIGSGFGSTTDTAASTTWWVDFSNFFQDVGALGGGNITLTASHDIMNVGAAIPTNARAARGIPSTGAFVELGGGDLRVTAGNDINGGVYYVERGRGSLNAGGSITTNGTRSPSFGLIGNLNQPATAQLDPLTWLPTTLFVGKSSFDLAAAGDLLLGPVSNPFLLPQGVGNKFWYKTYFSTISADSEVIALSLGGDVTYRNAVTLVSQTQAQPMLRTWHDTQLLLAGSASSAAWFQPWLRLAETSLEPFAPVWPLSAASLSLTAYSADLNLTGNLTTFPASTGQLELLAAGSVSALQPAGFSKLGSGDTVRSWVSSIINLSDANPASVPWIFKPLTSVTQTSSGAVLTSSTVPGFMNGLTDLFGESGSITGTNAVLQTRQARHTPGGLHDDDPEPVRIHALDGSLSGLTLFSGKQARITAATDITDVAFYIQNTRATDATSVTAGRDIIAYNSSSPLRVASLAAGNVLSSGQSILAGDIQISGPGTLQVLAGRNLDLGIGPNKPDGTGTGITSIGNLRNPYLIAEGADLVVGAGIGPASTLSGSNLDFASFIAQFASSPDGDRYLAEAKGILGVVTDYEGTKTLENGIQIKTVTAGGAADVAGLQAGDVILKISDREIVSSYDDSYLLSGIAIGEVTKVQVVRDGVTLVLDITPGSDLLNLADPSLTSEQQKQMALSIYNLVLRDTGRDFNDPDSAGYRIYDKGFEAIKALFPETLSWEGDILTQSRDIRTRSGGDISIFAPGGGLNMANSTLGNPLTPPGIVTESGGSINVFTDQSVGIGIGRIFTLKGGNVAIWSSKGDIAAGSSSRTVSAAPPTRVVIDPQSAAVQTDLAGLATGGGIGVLATVEGVAPGNVDLIAPTGIIDAGDAGIRVSGNINLAAVTVVNAGNISAGGSSAGAPVAASAPSISTVTSASNTSAAAGNTVEKPGEEQTSAETKVANDAPSLITVEVIGYGGGGTVDEDEEDDEKEKIEKPAEGSEVQ